MSKPSISKKSIIGAAIGTFIEYYEYSLFGLFLPIIAPLFFPADTTYHSLVKGYTILFIAMISRPLGGLWFGQIGDTTGRRKAMIASMYGIAISTIIIGITPSYHSIGFWATAIIVTAKSVQMFCFGGEYNGAATYVVEHAQNQREGFWGSMLTATVIVGCIIAALVGVIVTSAHLPDWSWRVAFVSGGLFGLFGIRYRKNMEEPPTFKPANPVKFRIKTMINKFPKELIAGVFVGAFSTVPFTTIITFINPVLMTKGLITSQQMMIIQLLLTTIAFVVIIISGTMADKFTPRKLMLYASILLATLSYPLMVTVDHGLIFWIIIAEIVFMIINELFLGPSNAFMKNIFPMEYRYRASSFSFCLGMSLIGGVTPLVENYLYQLTGHFSTASLWTIFVGIGSYLSIKLCHKDQSNVILVSESVIISEASG